MNSLSTKCLFLLYVSLTSEHPVLFYDIGRDENRTYLLIISGISQTGTPSGARLDDNRKPVFQDVSITIVNDKIERRVHHHQLRPYLEAVDNFLSIGKST